MHKIIDLFCAVEFSGKEYPHFITAFCRSSLSVRYGTVGVAVPGPVVRALKRAVLVTLSRCHSSRRGIVFFFKFRNTTRTVQFCFSSILAQFYKTAFLAQHGFNPFTLEP